MLALQLLNAVHAKANLRVSIFAACVNIIQAEEDTDTSTRNSVIIKCISHSTIAVVLRQWDPCDNLRSLGHLLPMHELVRVEVTATEEVVEVEVEKTPRFFVSAIVTAASVAPKKRLLT